jgi:phosphoribosylformylglycinamidine synthase
LPGALVRNRELHFICDRVPVRVDTTDLPWTRQYAFQEVVTLPIAHGEGCYYADPETLANLERNKQIVFRYCDAAGNPTEQANPNGSLANIAGICNAKGNVLGMMPHPERASDPMLGWVDGLRLFKGILPRF